MSDFEIWGRFGTAQQRYVEAIRSQPVYLDLQSLYPSIYPELEKPYSPVRRAESSFVEQADYSIEYDYEYLKEYPRGYWVAQRPHTPKNRAERIAIDHNLY